MTIEVESFAVIVRTRNKERIPHISIGLEDLRELHQLVTALGGSGIVSATRPSHAPAVLTLLFPEQCICDVDMPGRPYDVVHLHGDIPL